MKTLLILNDPPYGTERSDNGARLANALAKREGDQVRLFLIGDAVSCARRGQRTPDGYYNLETMLKAVSRRGGGIGVCGTCIDARGISEGDLLEGARRSTMDELSAWTAEADKVLVF